MLETINNDMVLRGDKKGGVCGVKRRRGVWVFIRLWKVIPDLHCIRKCKCRDKCISRIRKEEEEAQCIQGKKGHLYMGQLGRGKCMGLRRRELSLS